MNMYDETVVNTDAYVSDDFYKEPQRKINVQHVRALGFPRFKNFVKNDAPKGLRKLHLINLIVCCVCLVLSFVITAMESFDNIADIIAMGLTVLVMYLVKSRACAVILLIYSVLASLYSYAALDKLFACIPMILAGILSTITFLCLNRAYKKYKASIQYYYVPEVF